MPTAGNDLALIAALAATGLALGVAGGVATHVRRGDGAALARVGWIAGGLLVLGIVSAPFRLAGQLLTGIGRVLTGRS